MVVRTITITDQAYRNLSRKKRSGESFTEVINRLTAGTSPMDLVGALSSVPLGALENRLAEGRVRSRRRSIKTAAGMRI